MGDEARTRSTLGASSLWPLPYEAAIFDFDDTLAMTSGIWQKVDHLFFERRGMPYPAGLDEALAPLSFEGCAEYVISRFGLDERVEDICREWNDDGRRLYDEGVPLREGALAYLQRIHDAGVRCALATTNSSEVLASTIEDSGLDGVLDAMVFGDMVPVPKDKPDIYLTAAGRVGVEPTGCIVFDDIARGLSSARSCGMATCAVNANDTESARRAKEAVADIYLTSWKDIPIP